jgi:putative FmdB family regulatory protein
MYQYACRSCDEAFEKKLPMAQAGETQACPRCGSSETRKVIGAIAVSSGAGATARRAAPPPSSPFS